MPPKSKVSASTAAANNVAVGIPIKPDNRVLPTKEQGLFRNLLQLFEQKEYKKGMKITEQILKNYPEHGGEFIHLHGVTLRPSQKKLKPELVPRLMTLETIAMKAILLHNSTTDPKLKAEAYELIKKGVRNDLKSHIVWHIYGLMHRADKNYEEAMKCYVQANRIEENSLNILNDLAFLSIHLRRYDAYVLYRHTILRAQPRVRRHWIGLAVAQHLAGQYAEADTTLRHYEGMVTTVPENEYDFGEILMYHATILEEWGEFEKCLEFLSENSAGIVDKSAFTTMRGEFPPSVRLQDNTDTVIVQVDY
jgi:tetratricopeptide (TPR) repeat protein